MSLCPPSPPSGLQGDKWRRRINLLCFPCSLLLLHAPPPPLSPSLTCSSSEPLLLLLLLLLLRHHEDMQQEVSRAPLGAPEPGGSGLVHHGPPEQLLVRGRPAGAEAPLQPPEEARLHGPQGQRDRPEPGPLQLGDRGGPLPVPPLPRRDLDLLRGEHPGSRWVRTEPSPTEPQQVFC